MAKPRDRHWQDRLTIAPPRALGELRAHYGEDLKRKLVGELAKEHTHDTVHFLEQALKNG